MRIRKVIIADDERLVRVGLMHTVDWKRWNMEVVANAPNGEAAWELYQLHKPDLVITDIVMPAMDGLQLAHKIRQDGQDTKILFLSCHSDFSFAQQGMALGASGYLLKTAMDSDEVDRYLQRITEEWERVNAVEPNDINFLYSNWLKDGTGAAELNQHIRQTLEVLQEHSDFVLLFGLFGLEGEERQLQWTDAIDPVMLRTPGAPMLIIVPAVHAEPLSSLLLEQQQRDSNLVWKRSEPLRLDSDLMQAAKQMIRTEELERQYEVRTEAVSAPIMNAVMFIDQHLHEPIASSQLAGHVGLSRSHFSTLFKKELGISFLDYLHRRRIRTASELLLNTDWRIHLIGEKVGIEDNKHFSKWFKGHTGMTPSEFRENKLTTANKLTT